jgi:hypothetical protein
MRGRKRALPQEAGGSLETFAVPSRDISEFCRGPLSQILSEQDWASGAPDISDFDRIFRSQDCA